MEYRNVKLLPPNIGLTEIVVCLHDGDYDLGVAALVNSLVKAKFEGLVYCGYRHGKPKWINQLQHYAGEIYFVNEKLIIQLIEIDTAMHLGYYKPYFIKNAFDVFRLTNKIYFFDADITIKAPWKVFSEWLGTGACLCLDNSFHFVHNNHPWRKQWKALAPSDITTYRDNNYYFNSGFIAIERESITLIDRWIYFTEQYISKGGNINHFDKDDYNSLKGDQDLLNAAVTISPEIEISIIGQEGMGFKLPSTLMVHAIGDVKPWRNFFVGNLLMSGNRPCYADKIFFTHTQYPIRVFPKYIYLRKKADLLCAAAFGRLLG
jgi:hypothetical protein